jgi:pseudouridine kinase
MLEAIVIGGANADIKAKLAARHIPATSNPGEVSFSPGGVARNIAHNLAVLGVGVGLISAIGNDAAGQMLREVTAGAGVDMSMGVDCDEATGTYVAVLSETGELITAVNAMSILERLTWERVYAHADRLRAAKLVIADCNLSEDVLRGLAKHYGAKLVIEPVSVPKSAKLVSVLKHSSIFLATPNLDQLKAMTGTDDVEQGSARLLAAGLANIVVHLGSKGSLVNGRDVTAPLSSNMIADVTGAGDAAVAGLAFGLLRGYDLKQSARFGQAAAALKLTSRTSTVEGLTASALLGLVH